MNDNQNNHFAAGGDTSGQDAMRDDMSRHPTANQDQVSVGISAESVNASIPDRPVQTVSRQDTAHPDPSGQTTTLPDMARLDAALTDTSQQDGAANDLNSSVSVEEQISSQDNTNQINQTSTPNDTSRPFADWVDIESADHILREHGIARTIRTIQRMCKRGNLEARLVPTENGVRYLIERGSIHEFIDKHNQMMPSGNGKEPMLQDEIIPDKPHLDEEVITTPPPAQPSHMKDILEMKNEQLDFFKEQLSIANEQLRVKDEQINTMLERDHETNVLIQNLQQLMGLPAPLNQKPTNGSLSQTHQS